MTREQFQEKLAAAAASEPRLIKTDSFGGEAPGWWLELGPLLFSMDSVRERWRVWDVIVKSSAQSFVSLHQTTGPGQGSHPSSALVLRWAKSQRLDEIQTKTRHELIAVVQAAAARGSA